LNLLGNRRKEGRGSSQTAKKMNGKGGGRREEKSTDQGEIGAQIRTKRE
jgi:hypothetical protein